jgi:hypothetical protein
MAFASYLGDFDVDAKTSRALNVAVERPEPPSGLRTTLRMEASPGKSSNSPGPVISYLKAH